MNARTEKTLEDAPTPVNEEAFLSLFARRFQEDGNFAVLTNSFETARGLRLNVASYLGGALGLPIHPVEEWWKMAERGPSERKVLGGLQKRILILDVLAELAWKGKLPFSKKHLMGWFQVIHAFLQELWDAELSVKDLPEHNPLYAACGKVEALLLERLSRGAFFEDDLRDIALPSGREFWFVDWKPRTFREKVFVSRLKKKNRVFFFILEASSGEHPTHILSGEFRGLEVSRQMSLLFQHLEEYTLSDIAIVVRSKNFYFDLLFQEAKRRGIPLAGKTSFRFGDSSLARLFSPPNGSSPSLEPWGSAFPLDRILRFEELPILFAEFCEKIRIKARILKGGAFEIVARELAALSLLQEFWRKILELGHLGILKRECGDRLPLFIRLLASESYFVQQKVLSSKVPNSELRLFSGSQMFSFAPQVLFVLGLNEGHFPKPSQTSCLISAEKRNGWNKMLGENRFITEEEWLVREKEWLSSLIRKTAEGSPLFLSFSQCDANGALLLPSRFLPVQKEMRPEERVLKKREGNSRARFFFRGSILKRISATFDPRQYLFSVSELETLNRCSLGFYLSTVLGLKEKVPQTELLLPADRGTVLHKIVFLFYERRLSIGKNIVEVWESEVAKKEICELASHVLSSFPIKLAKPLLELECQEIQKICAEFVDWEVQNRKPGWKIYALEHPFGKEKPFSVSLSKDFTIMVRGVIDRIDVNPDAQEFAVYDYKTGSKVATRKEMQRGENVQLPLYAEALSRELPGFSFKEGGWFLLRKGKIRIALKGEDQEEVWSALCNNVAGALGDILKGNFRGGKQCPSFCLCRHTGNI